MPEAQAMDMHIHSVYSDAPKSTVEQITDVCKHMGFGACICDHNEIRGSVELVNKGEIPSLPSIEIGSAERLEFLLYFQTVDKLEQYFIRHVEPFKKSRFFTLLDRPFEELILAAKDLGAAVALPHPFAPSWKNINFSKKRKQRLFAPEIFSKIDLIEVINGHLPNSRNFKAFLLSEIFDKAAIAGSDSHELESIGNVYCHFDQVLSPAEMFQVFTNGIRVGMNQKFSMRKTALTSRQVIGSHLKLFVSHKNQKRWMVKYEATG